MFYGLGVDVNVEELWEKYFAGVATELPPDGQPFNYECTTCTTRGFGTDCWYCGKSGDLKHVPVITPGNAVEMHVPDTQTVSTERIIQ